MRLRFSVCSHTNLKIMGSNFILFLFLLCARGRWGGGRGGIGGGAPYKKMGLQFFFYSVQEVMKGVGSGGPKWPSRWPKATSLPQELEIGARRAPYLLVF